MRLLAFIALVSLAAPAAAGGYNVDLGSGSPIPSDAHAGPAGQPGHWNVVTGLEPEPVELFDTDGVASTVTLAFSLPFGPASHDHAGTEGDEAALLDDYLDLHSVPSTLDIAGLPKGTYEITTIAWAPDLPGARTSVSLDGRRAVLVGGEWTGRYASGVTHATHSVHVKQGGTATVRLMGIGRGSLNGLQIVRRGR